VASGSSSGSSNRPTGSTTSNGGEIGRLWRRFQPSVLRAFEECALLVDRQPERRPAVGELDRPA
jgi:hypothetical protein